MKHENSYSAELVAVGVVLNYLQCYIYLDFFLSMSFLKKYFKTQILLPSPTWANANKSKLAVHSVTEPGTYKLDGFSAGCKIVEVRKDSESS